MGASTSLASLSFTLRASLENSRWVVERCIAWLRWNRGLAKDYERKAPTSETLMQLADSRLLVRRLGKQTE